jgi:DnaK suppressor protein
VNPDRARELLEAERQEVERLLAELRQDAQSDRDRANEGGDIADPAEPLTAVEAEDAVAQSLEARLEAIGRAEQRLAEGTYGRSVRSGQPIPDERLEADPAAELTVEEAAADERARG